MNNDEKVSSNNNFFFLFVDYSFFDLIGRNYSVESKSEKFDEGFQILYFLNLFVLSGLRTRVTISVNFYILFVWKQMEHESNEGGGVD